MPDKPQIERKLAAIMFTDIAGYTALSAKDSTKASELLITQRDTLKPIVEEHGGSWMKEMGDGLLLTFDSATSAVECSIAIQEATKDIEDLNLRIGIHEGEVIKQDGDVIGDDVNVASRIEPFSAVGGVAISHKIEQAISSNTTFETKYIGKPKLKGVSQKVEVYCITSHGLPETDVSKVSAKLEEESKFNIFALTGGILTAIGIAFWIAVGVFDVSFGGKTEVPSIAIIPFENKGAKEDEFYAYSISSELISDVTSAGLIRVASIKDIEKLEYKTLDNSELSEKLLVRYIAQGTLWKVDSVFQLSMELYDTKSSKVLWSENWQKEWNELASIKGNLADNILKTLKVSTKQDIVKAPTTNTEAYKYYLEAKYIYEKRENMKDTEIARGLYRKAIELDDNLIKAKTSLGWTYYETGDYDKAMEIYSSALKQSEELGDKKGIGSSLNTIGVVYHDKDDYDKALDYYGRSLAIQEELGLKLEMGKSFNNIGIVYTNKGDYDEAQEYLERSLKIFEEFGDKRLMGSSLYSIGNVYSNKGDLDTALDYYGRALAIDEELGDKKGIGSSLIGIGSVHKNKGDLDTALDYYGRALTIKEKLGDKLGMGFCLGSIGAVYHDRGDLDIALDYYGRALAISEELGHKLIMGKSLNSIGTVYHDKGDLGTALDYYERSLAIKEGIGDKYGMGVELHNIGGVYANKGDLDTALDHYGRALAIDEELGDKYGMGVSLLEIGWIYYEIGEYNKALEYYNRELKINEELDYKDDISNNFANRGLVYFQQAVYNKAVENLDKSATMQMELDSTITLETLSHLFLSKKILGKEYNVSEIHTLIKEEDEIEDYINFALFKLLEDKTHLETAYNQVQERASAMDKELKAKFLSHPIPKAIVEEWEKVN